MKNIPKHYVKVRTSWFLVDNFSSKYIDKDFKNLRIFGKNIKNNKIITFSPSDVIAYYFGDIKDFKGLGMPYIPTADVCNILDTIVPDSMGYETHISCRIIEIKVGQPLNEYVAKKLKYTDLELCKSLSAEQVDAVAMAIYNIEEKNQGMIIGDQTGIGKGRVAAAMIRYGVLQGMKPIFLSEKPNLFTDIYRDLADIGSANLVPFIVNTKEAKTDIKDENGNVIYSAPEKAQQDQIIKSGKLPSKYDFICATYSQFSSAERKPTKPMFLNAIANDNLMILDESHNAGGQSQTGEYFQSLIETTRGVIFLSATFAKRPDNMPLYALKTAMSEVNMTNKELIEAITKGGVALQEILSAQLVSEGQMIRRERSFEGVEVNYITLTEKEKEHKAVYDNITRILRDIINFQTDYIENIIDKMDKIVAAEGKETEQRKGTKKAGVDNPPYFSKVFQVVNQMLFSIKAKSVSEMAIQRLAEGKKPIIAFSSTMETFLDDLGSVGDTIDIDFRSVLQKGLNGVLKYSVVDANGDRESKQLIPADIGVEAQAEYMRILSEINKISTGISLSPIDIIKNTIRDAGYTCDEITGRKYEVQLMKDTTGVLINRKKILANDGFRMFNNNELDCLLINQSGSTGASAHAIVTDKVPASEVKQRVMLVLQPELDINREVQKRGRINRTGQILKPIYDYVSSTIPAEQRLMMMLRKKLKSLDANTTSNQKQSENVLQVDDFLNKYGDKIVTEYLIENPELSDKLDDPLKFKTSENENMNVLENASSKVAGRVAVLTTEEQEVFYKDIIERYNDLVTYLKQSGQYDLEVEAMDLKAETLESNVVIEGRKGASVFAENTYLEKCEINNLKKPYTKAELVNLINQNLKGETAKEIQQRILQESNDFLKNKALENIEVLNKKYEKLISEITNEKKYKETKESDKSLYIRDRKIEIENARELATEKEKTDAENRYNYLRTFLNFFYIGKSLKYPTFSDQLAKAICCDIAIDKKKSNPYAPSSIKIRIAIANSEKYLDLALSGETGIKLMGIIGASNYVDDNDLAIIENWETYSRQSSSPRRTGFIVTGNILQGFSKYDSGKLISFTNIDGSIRKGILLPENYDPAKHSKDTFVTVPIIKALKYILEMSENASVYTPDNNIIINHTKGYPNKDYYLTCPANKTYQHIFKDKDIIKLSLNERDGFEKRGSNMIAFFEKGAMPRLIETLDKNHNLSVLMARSVYDKYFDDYKKPIGKDNLTKQAEVKYEQDLQEFEARKQQTPFTKTETTTTDTERERKIKIAKAKIRMLKLPILNGLGLHPKIKRY